MELTVERVRVHLIDEGSGTPVLFLHGNPDSADLWKGIIAQLNGQHRCLAPDLPGFGRSIAPANFDCSLDHMAQHIDTLLKAIGIAEPLNLVVHDFGGPFGLAWAVKHPAKVKRIVVMNTTFFSDYRHHAWARVWRAPLLGEISMLAMNRRLFFREMSRGSRKLTPDHIQRTYDLITWPMKRMVLRLYRATNPKNFVGWENRLTELTAKVPVLVLWGDRDPYISKRFAERFGAQQVVHFPDCGHWVPVEAVDEVSSHLLNFLQ